MTNTARRARVLRTKRVLDVCGAMLGLALAAPVMVVVAALVAMDQRGQMAPGQLYFGGTLGLDNLLDFLIWRQQADRLGIQLTAEDINRAVTAETLGQLTDQNRKDIERGLQLNRAGADQLVKALGEELRVRMARAALMGQEPGSYLRTPALITQLTKCGTGAIARPSSS